MDTGGPRESACMGRLNCHLEGAFDRGVRCGESQLIVKSDKLEKSVARLPFSEDSLQGVSGEEASQRKKKKELSSSKTGLRRGL